ncbi:MAG: CBS domain-containing protein [bacterium]
MKAKNIMNTTPLTIHADATFQQLVAIFSEQQIDGVCVVEGENKLVGVITLFELFGAFLPGYVGIKEELAHLIHESYFEQKCKELKHQPVRSLMRTEVITIKEEENLIGVMADISRFRLMVVPVVRGRTLVGTIARKGLLAYTGKVLLENNTQSKE